MFESLFSVLDNNLKERNFKNIKIPDEFKEYHNQDSTYIIKNWLFRSSQFRNWRITTLDGGEKLQVFNTVSYPILESETPIFGVDILWFGSAKKLLAVLDYQPLIQDNDYLSRYCSRLDLIKQKYPHFDNQKMKNIYESNQYFSPWVIICRGNRTHLENDLQNVFITFLEEYLKMNDKKNDNQFLKLEEIKQKHIEYDKYSAERDPADKLFKRFFGDIWTEKFVKNFLFTYS